MLELKCEELPASLKSDLLEGLSGFSRHTSAYAVYCGPRRLLKN